MSRVESQNQTYSRVRIGLLVMMLTVLLLLSVEPTSASAQSDPLFRIQTEAIEAGRSAIAHWGIDPKEYIQWGSHSNRLIPVYTFGTLGAGAGGDLNDYLGEHSVYRRSGDIADLYGLVPRQTLHADANYMDQTDLYRLQMAVVAAGKKHVFLVVFDGMDWETTRAASIVRTGEVYESGRGVGHHFQEYDGSGTSQFGWMVTSPHNEGTKVNVDEQNIVLPGASLGGYDPTLAGYSPWEMPQDVPYLINRSESTGPLHTYTDSSSSASSMTAGIKTYNNGVNVDAAGRQVETIGQRLQREGWVIGAVTSVPFSHATPAAAYAHNVHRDDYQDLSRDMLGLSSIAHPTSPLAGLDVVIGAGFGVSMAATASHGQGTNFVEGNRYLTDADLHAIDVQNGGRYVVAKRTPGSSGDELLLAAAEVAAKNQQRLFGFFGTRYSHLPFQTANGDFKPSAGRERKSESYSPADINENPSLAEMTQAALMVLEARKTKIWLMVEAGDVDWANHDNNLDNSVGAVMSGDAAVKVITQWVEENSNWNESLLIVTADHGHMLFLDDPKALAEQTSRSGR